MLGAGRVRFCATSAARDAENAGDFADAVESILGVRPQVLSGAEEALASFVGATRGLDAACARSWSTSAAAPPSSSWARARTSSGRHPSTSARAAHRALPAQRSAAGRRSHRRHEPPRLGAVAGRGGSRAGRVGRRGRGHRHHGGGTCTRPSVLRPRRDPRRTAVGRRAPVGLPVAGADVGRRPPRPAVHAPWSRRRHRRRCAGPRPRARAAAAGHRLRADQRARHPRRHRLGRRGGGR